MNPMPDFWSVTEDAIAACVLKAFAALPAKFKPLIRSPTVAEWVPLCGIVIANQDSRDSLECVSLG